MIGSIYRAKKYLKPPATLYFIKNQILAKMVYSFHICFGAVKSLLFNLESVPKGLQFSTMQSFIFHLWTSLYLVNVTCITPNITDVTGFQTFNFPTIQSVTQNVDFSTRFLIKCGTHDPLLALIVTSFPSSCRVSKHRPVDNFDHSVVSIDILFQSAIRNQLPIYKIYFRYHHAEWNSVPEWYFNPS